MTVGGSTTLGSNPLDSVSAPETFPYATDKEA